MGKYKLTIEYDGTRYAGWQIQKGGKTIQGSVLDACHELFKDGEPEVYGSGRTDSGVHAIGQVAHLEVETELPLLKKPIRNFMPGTMPLHAVIYIRSAGGVPRSAKNMCGG
jgi:tRNA pseudouridine38-40 synthase